jgi:hypothetical protein
MSLSQCINRRSRNDAKGHEPPHRSFAGAAERPLIAPASRRGDLLSFVPCHPRAASRRPGLRSPAGAARPRGADLKARYLCTEGAKVLTIKGRLQSPRDINSRPAPRKATVAPPSYREHAMPASLRERKRLQVQDNIPPVCPPCPTCGKEMTLVSVTPAMESVVFGYLCANDHVLEFTIGDR